MRRGLLALILGVLASVDARADEARPEVEKRNVRLLSFSQGSTQQVFTGTMMTEIGPRARFAVELGFVAPPWLEVYGRRMPGREWQPPVSVPAASVLSESTVHGGLRIGWRPLVKHGLAFDAGYRFVAINDQQARGFALGPEGLPLPPTVGDVQLDVGTTVHMATVDVSWEQPLPRRLLLRFDLGGAFVVANTVGGVTLAARTPSEADNVRQALLDGDLPDRLAGAVATPRLGVALGWRFY